MNSTAISIIALCTVLLMHWASPVAAEQQTKPIAAKMHKLRVQHLDFGNVPRLDVPYRFLSEKAHQAYSQGKLTEAEELYRGALKDAILTNAPHQQRVLLTANLAAVLRDEKKYEESETLFGEAVDISRIHLKKQQPLLDYVGSHYAGLLRKQGKELQAQFIQDAAKVGFEMKPLAASTSKTGFTTSTSESPFRTRERKQENSGPRYVDYTLTIEPLWNDNIDWYHRDPYGADPRNSVPRITAELDFTIESRISPIHVKVRTKPDTGVWPQGVDYTETWNHRSWPHPIVYRHSRPAPCALEPTTFRAKIPFYNRSVSSRTRWNGPYGKDWNTTSQGFFNRLE